MASTFVAAAVAAAGGDGTAATAGRTLLQAAAQAADDVPLTWKSWFFLAVLAVALVAMVGDWVAPDLAFAAMGGVLCAARVIDTKALVAGFSNTGVLTIVALYAVAEGIAQTGGLERVLLGVLGRRTTAFWGTVRLTLSCVVVSAFLNNTPIVAMLIPIVTSWAARANVDPRQLLIPMTFAVTLGGNLSLIGTTSNLVVTGLMEQRYLDPARLPPPADAAHDAALADAKRAAAMPFFYITPFGVPYAVAGLLYVWFASGHLLPGVRQGARRATAPPLFAMRVLPGSPAANRTVRASGVKGLEGLFLVSVGRQGVLSHAVGPDFLLLPGDTLYLSGDVRAATALAADRGLALVPADADGVGGRGAAPTAPLRMLSFRDVESGDGSGSGEESNLGSTKGGSLLPAGCKLVRAVVKRHGALDGVSVADAALSPAVASGDVVAVSRYGTDAAPGLLSRHILADGDVVVLSVPTAFSHRARAFRAAFRDAETIPRDRQRQFVSALRVTRGGGLAGKTLGETDVLAAADVHVLALDKTPSAGGAQLRGDDLHGGVVLNVGDTIFVSSGIEAMSFLLRAPGLALAADDQVSKLGVSNLQRRLVQAAVSVDSPLAGRTLRECRFRTTYDAVVVGVSRAGERVAHDVRDVRLRAGDLLLLDAGSTFSAAHGASHAFTLVSEVPRSSPVKKSRMWVALALALLMVLTQVAGFPLKQAGLIHDELVNLFPAALLTAGLMLALRCMTADQARKAVRWDVIVCVGFAFSVSSAMTATGVDRLCASAIAKLSARVGGDVVPLLSIYTFAGLLTEVLNNNATAALVYPIAARLGDTLGISPTLVGIAVMMGASDNFVSAFGHQTNLMCLAAGGYRPLDFVKFGAPLQALLFVSAGCIFAVRASKWWLALASILVAAVVVLGALVCGRLSGRTKHRRQRRVPSSVDGSVKGATDAPVCAVDAVSRV